MAKFTAQQTTAFRKLLNAIHPDKVEESRKELANKLTQMANNARDADDFATIADMIADLASGAIWEEKATKDEPKADEPKAEAKKESKPVVIDEAMLAKFKEQAESSKYTRRQMSGWLQLNTALNAREIKAYLDMIFTTEATGNGRKSYSDRLFDMLTKAPMTEAEVYAFLKAESDNAYNSRAHYWRVAQMANAIHAQK